MSADDPRPQPFRRQIQWGSPPKTVFRAGPLPSGGTLAPLPEPPQAPVPKTAPARPSGGGILTGSMIPQAPRPRPQVQPAPLPPVAKAPVMTEAEPPAPRPGPTNLTVRALPDPIAVSEGPAFAEVETPRAMPRAKRKGARLPLMVGAGIAACLAAAVGLWSLTRDTGVSDVAPPSAAVVPPLAEQPTSPPTPSAASAPAPQSVADAAPGPSPGDSPAEAPPQPRSPTPAAVVTASNPVSASRTVATPQIDTAPLVVRTPEPVVQAPTVAERPPSDPDAPVVTRPQPLD